MEKGTEMAGTRIRLGFAVAVLGMALSGGVAGAVLLRRTRNRSAA